MATSVGPITTSPGLPGGLRAMLDITTAQVVKAGPGILSRVSVIVAGSTAGTANDVATTGGAAVANEFGTIPNVIGTYTFNWPCGAGIVVVPGTGQTLAVAFT